MSIHKVSAGHGDAYVLKSVANADGHRTAPDQITRYTWRRARRQGSVSAGASRTSATANSLRARW